MNPVNREELLSAYLDGEVTADERAQVERWLAEDDAYRQLHDELRAAGSRLKALPRHKLDRDLAASVLRQAERAVLAGEGSPHPGTKFVPSTVPQWWSGRSWRMVAWPAAAVAAALAIAIFSDRQAAPERQVAQHAPRGAISIEAADQQSVEGAPALSKLAASSREEDAAPAPTAPPVPAADDESAMARKRFAASPAEGAPGQSAASKMPAAAPALNQLGKSVSKTEAPTSGAEPMNLALQVLPDTITFDVARAFVDEHRFERLLDAKKIPWERPVEDKLRLDELKRAAAEKESLEGRAAGEKYVLQATQAELADVVATLKAEDKKLVKLAISPPVADQAGRMLKDARPADQPQRQDTALRRRVYFLLRPTLDAPPPATPNR